MKNKLEILVPDFTYHVYNRANGSERVFKSEENYRYFLTRYQEFISPLADTLLLPDA